MKTIIRGRGEQEYLMFCEKCRPEISDHSSQDEPLLGSSGFFLQYKQFGLKDYN